MCPLGSVCQEVGSKRTQGCRVWGGTPTPAQLGPIFREIGNVGEEAPLIRPLVNSLSTHTLSGLCSGPEADGPQWTGRSLRQTTPAAWSQQGEGFCPRHSTGLALLASLEPHESITCLPSELQRMSSLHRIRNHFSLRFILHQKRKEMTSWLDVTAHAFNRSTQEAEALDRSL